MAFQAVAVSVAFSVISILLLPILLKWIGQDIYQAEISLYYWILAAMIAYSLSMVPHYALYARGHDRAIIASHIAALMVFIIATLASTYISASYAVPIGVLVAMGTVLIWKTSAYFKVFHRGTDAEAQPVPGVI